MNYYIQGDAAKADKIKAAFEELGINVLDFGFADKAVVYCSIGECVQYLPYSINLMNILYSHPDYQELELSVKPKPKVGDWVVKKDGTTFYGGNYAEQVTLIEGDGYLKRIWFSSGTWLRDNDIRLWSIQDAKDGDVITNGKLIVIFNKLEEPVYRQHIIAYVGLDLCGRLQITEDTWRLGVDKAMPATKEQRDLLFMKMKEAGYQWDSDNKELHKIQPHYDIKNFKPFDKVLVRDDNSRTWKAGFYSHRSEDNWFVCAGSVYIQCIPFNDDTKHLLGTTDMCDERFINW